MSDDWLEGEEATPHKGEEATPHKGEIVNKARLIRITGLAEATIERCFADGAPIISKGTRKQGWQINSAAFFDWFWRRKVESATGDPNIKSFEAAKRREKEAAARLKELEVRKREGELEENAVFVEYLKKRFADYRTRLLQIPSQVTALTPEQREQLDGAIHDLLTDISEQKADNWHEVDDAEEHSELG